jgi:hypothetical protein
MPSILTIWGFPTGKKSSAALEKHAKIQTFTNHSPTLPAILALQVPVIA